MAYTTINKSGDYFNTKLYTGNGGTQHSITGVGFQPDWTWIKSRDDAYNHFLFDAVRGVGKQIYSNTTGAEATNMNNLYSFNADGFSLAQSANDDVTNKNNSNFSSWNWKAGTTGSGNTGGSGTYKAYSYSVNTTAGFSITTYKGNGTAGHQIPHSLGVAPSMFIIKDRDNTRSWYVYHKDATYSGSNPYSTELYLDTTDRAYSAGTWNNVAPTSTTFQTSGGSSVNGNDIDYICYAFAEKAGYSKFGSYTGNGNADGTFIYLGFKPAFVMFKRSDGGTENWALLDSTRSYANVSNHTLAANSSNAESSFGGGESVFGASNKVDILSNGIKIREASAYNNTSGATYIFMAFGQSLVGSNNVPCTAR